MSVRDDQPATVPPPDGEDDAYSATTKVGAMPSDIMEKLRAEGLLPEETAEPAPTSLAAPRPNTSAPPRVTPPPPASSDPPVPRLFSNAPPGVEEERLTTKIAAAPLPIGISNTAPIASPTTSDASENEPEEQVAAPVKAPSKTTTYIVAAVVVLLLIVALLRLRG